MNDGAPAIRVLINALHARSGGGRNYVTNMVPRLAREPGLELHVLLHEEDAELEPAGGWPGVTVHVVAFPTGFWRRLWREQVEVPQLAREIGADVTFSPANFGPYFAPGRVVLIRNALAVGGLERRPHRIGYWALLAVATALSIMTARGVMAVSEYARNAVTRGLLRPWRRRITVVPHGVGPPFTTPADGLRGAFILAVGDIYVQKNYATLVEAMRKIRRAHPDLALRIAGSTVDHSYFATLERRVAELNMARAVEFLGGVALEPLAELYRQCALFVFPSKVETFGNPLLEAMAAGAPIACSRAAAMPEVLGDAGVYFDPDNPNDIADTIDRMLREPRHLANYGARARARAAQFTWEATAAATAAVLRRAARGRRSAGVGWREADEKGG
jgi:glycosyltransferase involved in cell wall biosynthesis